MNETQHLPRLIVASNNQNKIREFRAILGTHFEIVSMKEAGMDTDIEETGTTFEENALIKANYVMNACGQAAIADDSGLEVDALNGEPAYTAHVIADATATMRRTTSCCSRIWLACRSRVGRAMLPRLRLCARDEPITAAALAKARF